MRLFTWLSVVVVDHYGVTQHRRFVKLVVVMRRSPSLGRQVACRPISLQATCVPPIESAFMTERSWRIYLARAIENMPRAAITALSRSAAREVDGDHFELVDANREYLEWKARNPELVDSNEYLTLVPFQIALLKSCDGLLMDMTIPNRNYVGCCSELVYAYSFHLPSAVYVGDTDNGARKWLQYHATFICRERRDALAFLREQFLK